MQGIGFRTSDCVNVEPLSSGGKICLRFCANRISLRCRGQELWNCNNLKRQRRMYHECSKFVIRAVPTADQMTNRPQAQLDLLAHRFSSCKRPSQESGRPVSVCSVDIQATIPSCEAVLGPCKHQALGNTLLRATGGCVRVVVWASLWVGFQAVQVGVVGA